MNKRMLRRTPWLAAAVLGTCIFTASANALEDFESYASEAAFDAAWRPVQAAQEATVPVTLDTAVAHSGSQSMRINYNLGADPFFGQDRFDFPVQDWSQQSLVEFWYLGEETNSKEILGLRFYSSFGSEIGRVQLPIEQTQVSSWTRGVLDLSNFTPGGAVGQENDVTQIRIALTGSDFGGGVLWIDDIRAVPEPGALMLAMVASGGWLVSRRKRSR